jgi:hypothetical protein
MNDSHDFVENITSGDIPTGVLAVAGVALIFVALKVGKRFLKVAFVLLGLAALAGAVWWHFHKH